MKNLLRSLALLLVIALPGLGLAACDTDDDCDAAGTHPVTVAAAAHFPDGKSPGGKSRSGKSRHGSSKAHGKVHGSDNDCEDND